MYPNELINSYRGGKITRQEFTTQFSDWQKSRGINYDCKGTDGKVTYRGRNAVIRDGRIEWSNGEYRDTAGTVTEFMRKVDIAICDRLRGAEWN